MRRQREIYEKVKNVAWAAFFAIALWFVMVQSAQQTKEIKAKFQVFAPGLNVGYNTQDNQPPEHMIVVRGSPTALRRVPDKVDAIYEIPQPQEAKLGERTILLREFAMKDVGDVEVEKSTLTGDLTIQLSKLKRQPLPIALDEIDKTLDEGWEVEGQIALEPSQLEAQGPEDTMKARPKLIAGPLRLRDALVDQGFNPARPEPQSFVIDGVDVRPPPDSKISIVEKRSVRLRVRARPRPAETDIDLAPAFLFPGPELAGFPYSLAASDPAKNKITIRIQGPENDLAPAQIDTTKKKILVYVKVTPDDLKTLEAGKGVDLDVKVLVLPPSVIKVVHYAPDKMIFERKAAVEGPK